MEKPRIKINQQPMRASPKHVAELEPAQFDSIVDLDPYTATEKLRKHARWTRRKGQKKGTTKYER